MADQAFACLDVEGECSGGEGGDRRMGWVDRQVLRWGLRRQRTGAGLVYDQDRRAIVWDRPT